MLKQIQPKGETGSENAREIALKLLAFMAADSDLLGRFMALSGLSPGDLRAGLSDPGFLGGVLDFALSDESLLLAFSANAGIDPASVMRERAKLPGFSP